MRPVYSVFVVMFVATLLGACSASTAQTPSTQPSLAPASSTTAAPTVTLIPTAASAAATTTLPTTVATSDSTTVSATAAATTTTSAPTTQLDATSAASAVPTHSATAVAESPLVTQARTALLVQPGLGQQTLTLQSEKEIEWPTSALGCPEPGKSYLQVITPGVQIIFSDGARTYDIHTTRTGDALIWCDDGTAKMIGASK